MPLREILRDLKWQALAAFFGRWRRPRPSVEGYTILLPSPMDMPFLLRFALEGIRHVDTSHCRQIIVIPDGYGADRGAALQQVVDSCNDSRVQLVRLRPTAHFLVHRIGSLLGGINPEWAYWAMVIEGINQATSEYIFLHDADAFWLEADALERQYRKCRGRGMATLGVMARWDPFFREIGYTIPGTYELMFSARWARRYSPLDLKAQKRLTKYGFREFDTMLYPQFQEYPSGKIGVLEPPMRLVHFNGAITIYRLFRERMGQPLNDDGFRLLFLALMEDLIPSSSGDRLLPSVSDLARGLDDPSAMITYGSSPAARDYPTFRAMIEDLCNSPIFQGARAAQVRASIYPFDRHYENRLAANAVGATDSQGGAISELDGPYGSELAGKRLEILTEIKPQFTRLAIFSNPSNPSHGKAIEQIQTSARSAGIEIRVAQASSENEYERAFAAVIAGRAEALIVLADEMFFKNHLRILTFTEFSRLPALFVDKEIAAAGGLMAYGPTVSANLTLQRATGVEPATKFKLAINLKTANSLGLTIPCTLIHFADEVFK
jgi:hypothetical protein